MTKIINLVGGPGVGKSTGASYLFANMKMRGIKVELIHEYPKELVYEKRFTKLASQVAIFGEQDWRQRRLLGQVDFIITDSPLILGSIYAPEDYPASFKELVLDVFHSYENINFLLRRVKPYADYGRNQNESESDEISAKIRNYLYDNYIMAYEVTGDKNGYDKALELILHKYV